MSEEKLKILLSVDAAICGRYKPGVTWNNKQLILVTDRITADDLNPKGDVEISVKDGMAFVTGYPKK